jgi:hypothetical protein
VIDLGQTFSIPQPNTADEFASALVRIASESLLMRDLLGTQVRVTVEQDHDWLRVTLMPVLPDITPPAPPE